MDLVSRLITGIARVTICFTGVINLLTEPQLTLQLGFRAVWFTGWGLRAQGSELRRFGFWL